MVTSSGAALSVSIGMMTTVATTQAAATVMTAVSIQVSRLRPGCRRRTRMTRAS